MQRNSRQSRRNKQQREKFEGNGREQTSLAGVPERPPRQSKHTQGVLQLRTERDGTPMINVGLTEAQIDNLILIIDDDPDAEEPDEEQLDQARRKLVNRLNRMKQLLEDANAASA